MNKIQCILNMCKLLNITEYSRKDKSLSFNIYDNNDIKITCFDVCLIVDENNIIKQHVKLKFNNNESFYKQLNLINNADDTIITAALLDTYELAVEGGIYK